MTEEQLKRILQAGHSVLCNVWGNYSNQKNVRNVRVHIVTGLNEKGGYKEDNGACWDHAKLHHSVSNRYFERDGIVYKWLTAFEADEAEKFIGRQCMFSSAINLCFATAILKRIYLGVDIRFMDEGDNYWRYVAVPLTNPKETLKQKQLRELKEKAQELNEQIQKLETE